MPLGGMPSNTESGLSGRNVPVNGAEPLAIGIAAASSKTVFVKLSPEVPLLAASVTWPAFGPTR